MSSSLAYAVEMGVEFTSLAPQTFRCTAIQGENYVDDGWRPRNQRQREPFVSGLIHKQIGGIGSGAVNAI